jgi:thymidylate synthase
MRKLYLKDKYRVWEGEGEGIGFCTVWSDPEKILESNPELKKKVALIGTLYSPEGVNIVLRNLCLSPDITNLVLWGRGELSKTSYGKSGVSVIKRIWESGFIKKFTDYNFQLHQEFDIEVLKKVVSNVQLLDWSGLEINEAIKKLSEIKIEKKYMKPISFPDHQPESGQVLPSEKIGFLVRGRKTVDAWLKAVDHIMRYGLVKKTEYGNEQRETANLTWVIENENISDFYFPDWDKSLLKRVGLDKDSMDEYHEEFLSSHLPEGTIYTYGQRLRNYPAKGIDQVEEIIEHLKKSPITRRAVATTLYPPEDKQADSPPCINQVQFLRVNERLAMFVLVRSHDLFKAALPNAFGLLALQDYVCGSVGIEPGPLTINSISAHIYEEDWEDALDLLKCQIWEKKPDLSFQVEEDGDPRGNLLVQVEGKEIVVNHLSPDGAVLAEYRVDGEKPKAALKMAQTLFQHRVISKIGHALDIGEQLGRAEDAIKLGKKFEQDKMLK